MQENLSFGSEMQEIYITITTMMNSDGDGNDDDSNSFQINLDHIHKLNK